MHDFSTPMIKQYLEIKSEYKDCLLFYRMGDFYELFFDDAKIGSQILNITLTGKSNGKNGRIPMAGVPYHAVDAYLSKLVQAGFKVAICEQVSLPNKKGLVEREVIRVVTPGTILDEKALNKKDNNYIISLFFEDDIFSITAADISTGYLLTSQYSQDDFENIIKNELVKFHPKECVLPDDLYNAPKILKVLKLEKGINIFNFSDWYKYSDNAYEYLKEHFKVKTLTVFNLEEKLVAQKSTAALLGYLKSTQKSQLIHLKKVCPIDSSDCLSMDRSTMLNLELFSTIREHDVKGSLFNLIDETVTAMGGRLLKQWLIKPLIDYQEINDRLDAVEEYISSDSLRDEIREYLKQVNDLERITSRLSVGLGNARDLVNLKLSLTQVLLLKESLNKLNTELNIGLADSISPKIKKVIEIIDENIKDEPLISLRDGGLIKDRVNSELDFLKNSIKGAKDWVMQLETKERSSTGINSLKVRFNKVFGFYIEVSKSNLDLVPDNYIRKQTLVNGERFITEELKEKEEIILSNEEKINELEYKIYLEILTKVLNFTEIIQEAAKAISVVDCLTSFAQLSIKEGYTRPKLIYSGDIKIKGARHPVVEKLIEDRQFVVNDVNLDQLKQPILLITGPNMAGKSVYIRQVALIVLMAQIGCFVPAEQALISVVDKIFVRSGASDVITSGLSTFMVEMVETAYILNNATEKSLIVMDEIGRGTSTYDGISIAWAVAEHLASNYNLPPKTLFATHYHELQALEDQYPSQIKNYHMLVDNEDEQPVFLYTIKQGGASKSFGIAVAKLAGIPKEVIERAEDILSSLGSKGEKVIEPIEHGLRPVEVEDIPFQSIADHILLKEVETLDLYQMTPLEALNKLAEIKNKLKLIRPESRKFFEVD